MTIPSHQADAKIVFPDWILWAVYGAGFAVTLWALQHAEITMVFAHRQWEIHQETALKIALYVWVPIFGFTWLALRFLRSRSIGTSETRLERIGKLRFKGEVQQSDI